VVDQAYPTLDGQGQVSLEHLWNCDEQRGHKKSVRSFKFIKGSIALRSEIGLENDSEAEVEIISSQRSSVASCC
jgi:hypothetical protein